MDSRIRPPSTSYSTASSYFTRTATYKIPITGGDSTSHHSSYQTRPAAADGISTSYHLNTTNDYDTATASRPPTVYRSNGRPGTATTRPRTGYSTLGMENQEIVCAVSESRGVSPMVGLAFINLDTGEAVLSQLNDSQTYVKTTHKITVFQPTYILIVNTAAHPKSKLFSILEDQLDDLQANIILLDRQYWSETTGLEYISQLAFRQDVESIKTAVTGNYFAVCCFAAALKYTELALAKTFPMHSLRLSYQPSEGSMTIDLATIKSLELVQNLHDPKSKHCLFGLLNETLTPMGARTLRSNILQPVTDSETLGRRYDAVEELSTKEQMFFSVRQALKTFLDADQILTKLIVVPKHVGIHETEQAINNVIALKHLICNAKPVFEALAGARSEMLLAIQSNCAAENVDAVLDLITSVINEDVTFARKPLDMRNQRTYAVKSGVNGLLDVARQTYRESTDDALTHMTETAEEQNLPLQTKFEAARQFYFSLRTTDLENQKLPPVFINVYRRKQLIECQTLDLVKQNQKISDAHHEVLLMSDEAIQHLISAVREHMFALFKIAESVAMLDMLSSFAHAATSQDYVRPLINEALALRAARHPIREKLQRNKFIPNDIYATSQTRFQILTGANMSGKSTYIRTVALLTLMAQVGSFVPATYAAFPIIRQLFARVSLDDNIEANVSTFAAEMREAAFILRNIEPSSMAIIDELGRGTSTRDGMAIALSIAEALIESKALVWFATHFRGLSTILSERPGVVALHLAVSTSEPNTISPLYRLASGTSSDTHYGLQLARLLPLPPDVLPRAEYIASTLENQMRRRKNPSLGVLTARRRKLMLNLKEHLMQARDGRMSEQDLRQWLGDLQGEFVTRMVRLDEERREIEAEGGGDEEEILEDGEGSVGSFVEEEEDSTGGSTVGGSYGTRDRTTGTEVS
ncbi:hypothetical protein M409DRAFT_23075 [Zasmidium cellare ATCC 36951]|uniref:DNA mismatch repair protein MSH3 n=1 Tax=Zasmidium cellare ATCC 36951 TaxID=1080233 RepID=A0A6A6CIK2_ZASCE|nr:uncharacterized protein M409DRAFT_23075 [Zasmidium cellare ATCC 36951]KAF2166433.1 hypothetical protein M409DRAFT_23075 [Zasmidium cellare ATCC 36951]